MRPSTPITLVLAHFEDLLARGLRAVIDSDASLEIVADDVAADRLDVVLRAHRPQVAILDVDALAKLAQVRELSRRHPDTHLVLLTRRATTTALAQLLAFGASACLSTGTQARDVLTAIHLASRGLQLIPRESADSAALPPPGSRLLTPREADVLAMLQQGSSNAEIALALGVGVETIRTHARNIYRKLGVSSRRELATVPPRVSPDAVDAVDAADAADAAAAAAAADDVPGSPTRRRFSSARDRQRHPGSRRR